MDEQLPSAIRKALLARTRRGRIFKTTVFWMSFFALFVIPLGAVVLYFLWKHGDRIAAEDGIDVRSQSGELS